MQICETFFSSRVSDNGRITLIEGDEVFSEDREVAETFKSYIMENLGINNKFMSGESVSNESVNFKGKPSRAF